ncbi:MAG: c-type cytochrome [Planctomycetes bacterium]|nr:c-type cytochrome [Planctomycetota bacterium]
MGTKHVEHHYDIPRLNRVFAWSSLALLVSIVGLVWWDYSRPWKRIQRDFMARDLEKTKNDMLAAVPADKQAELDAIEKDLAAAKAELDSRERDPKYAADQERAKDAAARQYIVDSTAKKIKSVIDSRRFYYEQALKDEGAEAAEPLGKELHGLIQQRNAKLDELKVADEEAKAANDALAAWTKKQDETQTKINEITKKRDLLAKKAKTLEPDWINKTRNAVILDMLQPTVKPKQIVTSKIQDDWVFEKANKVDRCTSCHLAIDKEGWEQAPQPFRSHPNLALFVSSKSPHKMDDVGCTVCHQGRGWAMDFERATHTPDDEKQKEEWVEKYGWFHDHWWDEHMFPKTFSEAGCYVCHQEQLQFGNFPRRDEKGVMPENAAAAAPLLDQGIKLVYDYGCYACHKIGPMLDPAGSDLGMRDFVKRGPDLRHVGVKLDERFVNKWLQNPKHFRPATRMPRIFGLENHETPELKAREQVEINSVAYYIVSRSTPFTSKDPNDPNQPEQPQHPSGPGDAERGKSMFASVGCLACHTMNGIEPATGKEQWKATFGPDLSAVGSKTTYEWIYSWIMSPVHYAPDTRMPSLRLTPDEGRDVATFLAAQRNEAFDKEEPIGYDPKVLDKVSEEYLLTTLTVDEASKRVATMSTEDKELLVGEKIVNRYGCHGCHWIPGKENEKQIGTELTEEGSKDVERLDFGYLKEEPPHLEPTNYAWFQQKLLHPRSFDRGRDKTPEDLLKMPQFDFTEEQAKAITTFILSLRKTGTIPYTSQKHLNPREKAIEKGHRILLKHNCQGCHSIDGHGGETMASYLPPDAGPPPIDGAGKKIQSQWLFTFLKNPSKLRVISVRMPTFGFTDAEANAVIQYLDAIWNESYPFDSSQPGKLSPEDEPVAKQMFEKAKCQSCHVTSDPPVATDKDKVAPNLLLAKVRLKPNWVNEWLLNPQALQPNTKMPSFYDDTDFTPNPSLAKFFEPANENDPDAIKKQAHKQIDVFRDYLFALRPEDVPKAQQ